MDDKRHQHLRNDGNGSNLYAQEVATTTRRPRDEGSNNLTYYLSAGSTAPRYLERLPNMYRNPATRFANPDEIYRSNIYGADSLIDRELQRGLTEPYGWIGPDETSLSSLSRDMIAARRENMSSLRKFDSSNTLLSPTILAEGSSSYRGLDATYRTLQEQIAQEEFRLAAMREESDRRLSMRQELATQLLLKRQHHDAPRVYPEDNSIATIHHHNTMAAHTEEASEVAAQEPPPSPARKDSSPRATNTVDELSTSGAIAIAMDADKLVLSPYQQILRQSLEFFVVSATDEMSNSQGRHYRVKVGQIGIRCRFCKHRPMHWRGRGSLYFPTNLTGVYQAAQNLGIQHLLVDGVCVDIPHEHREKMLNLRKASKRRYGGGKSYWERGCRTLGLYDRPDKPGVWVR